MKPESRSRAPPVRYPDDRVRRSETPAAARGSKPFNHSAIQEASKILLDMVEDVPMGDDGEDNEDRLESANESRRSTRSSSMLPSRQSRASFKKTPRRRAASSRGKLPQPREAARVRTPTSRLVDDAQEDTIVEEVVDDAIDHGRQSSENPNKTWREYQEELNAERRELERLARQPMTQRNVMTGSSTRATDRPIKREITDADSDSGDVAATVEQGDDTSAAPPGPIKTSIEEEEEVKPALDSFASPDLMEEDVGADPDQLQEITRAAYAPTDSHRREQDMMDELNGMNLNRRPRSARSVAPRDFSRRRASKTPYSSRYESGKTTRSGYRKHLSTAVNPDLEAAERTLEREDRSRYKRMRRSGVKASYSENSAFQGSVRAMTAEKERAEAEVQLDEDEEMEDDGQ